MRIAMLPGLRFQGPQVLSSLKKLKLNVDVYSSARQKHWPDETSRHYKFIPMPFTILQRTTGIIRNKSMKEFDARFFDNCSKYLLDKTANIIHGWATFSLESGKYSKRRGGFYFLERACPHIHFQTQLLKEEADILGVQYKKSSDAFIERTLEEYEVCDKIIVPSDYSLKSFISVGFPEEKLIKAPLGPNFKPKLKEIYTERLSQTPFVVGFIGGNALRKGLTYLVEAWQKLKLKKAVLKLKISKKELERYPNLLAKILSDPTIEVVGYVSDIEKFYRGCDLFCLPSIDDGFGMVAPEALACGVPVIVSKNAGASELLSNKDCTDVVDAKNAQQISIAIHKYYVDRELLSNAKTEALKLYKEITITDHHFNAMKDLYEEVLDV